jgi:hypothetical protein
MGSNLRDLLHPGRKIDPMPYFVDGHNALHRLEIRGSSHEADRRELLIRVRDADPGATVFFDARKAPRGLPGTTREEGLRVVYCREREADREILDRVRDAARPSEIIVVTDDREVAGGARQMGARSVRVDEFLGGEAAAGPEEKDGPGGFRPEDFDLPGLVNLDHPPGDLREE